MSDYSYPDLARMQEEAKRRVMDMRRRSRLFADSVSGRAEEADPGALPVQPKAISLPVEYDRPVPKRQPADKKPAQKKDGLSTALGNVFGKLSREETEKMFILSLCLLLSNENCDDELLLSLMYLLT